MATVFKLKRFSKYDDFDRLKEMSDEDLLSEKKKHDNEHVGAAAKKAAGGAIAGAGAGLILNTGLKHAEKHGKNLGVSSSKTGKAIKLGALGLATLRSLPEVKKAIEKAEENKEYNERLKESQRQAKRREKKDYVYNNHRNEYTK